MHWNVSEAGARQCSGSKGPGFEEEAGQTGSPCSANFKRWCHEGKLQKGQHIRANRIDGRGLTGQTGGCRTNATGVRKSRGPVSWFGASGAGLESRLGEDGRTCMRASAQCLHAQCRACRRGAGVGVPLGVGRRRARCIAMSRGRPGQARLGRPGPPQFCPTTAACWTVGA